MQSLTSSPFLVPRKYNCRARMVLNAQRLHANAVNPDIANANPSNKFERTTMLKTHADLIESSSPHGLITSSIIPTGATPNF
eukprot:4362424-Amphidinium_carterae.2